VPENTEGNPNIQVEITDPSEFHCFRLVLNAKAAKEHPDREPIVVMLHARSLVDLIHKASLALCDWQKTNTDKLLEMIVRWDPSADQPS
jgi:hypothetical protein